MVHRVDLHNALRSQAEKGFEGRCVSIHLNSKIESVVSDPRVSYISVGFDTLPGQDAEAGEVHLQDGRTVRGDLIIGADGLHVSISQPGLSVSCLMNAEAWL